MGLKSGFEDLLNIWLGWIWVERGLFGGIVGDVNEVVWWFFLLVDFYIDLDDDDNFVVFILLVVDNIGGGDFFLSGNCEDCFLEVWGVDDFLCFIFIELVLLCSILN